MQPLFLHQPSHQHWHILGAGAIGCLWGGQMIKSGLSITLLVKPERGASLPTRPKVIIHDHQGISNFPVTVETTRDKTPISHLIVTTKAGDTLAAIKSVQSRLTENAIIVLLQNGLGSQQAVADAFSHHAVFAGSTTDGVWLKNLLSIHRTGRGQTWLGPLNEAASSSFHGSAVHTLLTIQDMEVFLTKNILYKLQEKLAINSAINGLTALIDRPNGDLLKPELQRTVSRLCRDTEAILASDGYSNNTPLLEMVNRVLTITATNVSSSLQDVRKGRPTELPWINGYLLTLAEKNGVSASAHQELMQTLAEKGIR